MSTPPGDLLLSLAAESRSEFVMCAPFAKRQVVAELLSVVKDDIRPVLYTRWRPEEIAAGVSDTEVLDLLRARGGTVLLHDRVHAKFYRNEHRVLVGSANLTQSALGWARASNLELLVAASRDVIAELEALLDAESAEATYELANEVAEIAAMLPKRQTFADPDKSRPADQIWLPTLRFPSDLFTAYSRGTGMLSEQSQSAAVVDLAALDLPIGLDEHQFRGLVRSRLRQQSLIRALDSFLTEPRRFGEVRDYIGELAGLDRYQATTAWQTTMRWILEFLPERYTRRVFRRSEVVVRSEVIDGSSTDL